MYSEEQISWKLQWNSAWVLLLAEELAENLNCTAPAGIKSKWFLSERLQKRAGFIINWSLSCQSFYNGGRWGANEATFWNVKYLI